MLAKALPIWAVRVLAAVLALAMLVLTVAVAVLLPHIPRLARAAADMPAALEVVDRAPDTLDQVERIDRNVESLTPPVAAATKDLSAVAPHIETLASQINQLLDDLAALQRTFKPLGEAAPKIAALSGQFEDLQASLRRLDGRLAAPVDLMLATGCRIGEAAGFIYPEIDLSSETPTLTVSGTIVTETGKGTFRQPWTKSDAGYRTLFLPPFAVDILMRRMIESPANRNGAVFTTRNGTWRQVSNWERLWNRVVDGTAYDWVTFHTFRKSVATLIDQTVDSKAAQAQLGHANEDITLEHYIHKAKVAPDLTDYLERFRPPITPKT